MKIQNNVNANPTFGTRIKLTGSKELADKFTRALEGGFMSQRRGRELMTYSNPLVSTGGPAYITAGKDVVELGKKIEAVGIDVDLIRPSAGIKSYGKDDLDGLDIIHQVIHEGGDVLDLSKPLRFIIEGAADATKRFISALRGGLDAQDVPLVIAYNPKKTLIAIDKDAAVWSDKIQWFKECGGRADSGYNEIADEFFKNAQAIHVTK